MRIVRQLLTESVMLSLAGGVIGILLAVWGINVLLAISPSSIPRKHEISIDGYVLAFTFTVSLATGVLFGLAPAFQISRFNLSETLKEGARGSTGGHAPLRSLLVVAEVALSLVLLIGAGLLLNSFSRLLSINPGFDPKNVLAMKMTVGPGYEDEQAQVRLFRQIIEKVKALPGVESAGAVSYLPLGGEEEIDQFIVEGLPAPSSFSDTPLADFRFIDDGYFSTLKIPLVAGRNFTERDNDTAPPVIIISESLARRFFAGQQPIGKRIKAGDYESRAPWATIVGVAKDVKHSTLEQETRPQLYFPYQQKFWGILTIVARSNSDAKSLSAAMRNAVWDVDKDQPIAGLRMMEEYLADAVSQKRQRDTARGIRHRGNGSGVSRDLRRDELHRNTTNSRDRNSYSFGSQTARRVQAGSRARLKAHSGGCEHRALRGVRADRLMESLLYNVSATDPVTFVVIPIVLAGVALGACFMPARRATKVDPMVALRYE